MKTLITSIHLSRGITTAIFGALALSCGAVGIAAESGGDVPQADVPQTVVQYGDLNLSNPHSADTLYRRIAAAAHEVCKPFDIQTGSLVPPPALTACVHKAIVNAVAKVDRPELFAVYNTKNEQPFPMTVAARTR